MTSPAETLRAQLAERLAREDEQRREERQRRLAAPEDFLYDKAQEAYWDKLDNTLHSEGAVNASIPRSRWRVEVTEGGPAEGGRGRPRARRERLIEPHKDIQRVENGQFVEGSTWWPGKPQIIEDWFIDANGAYPAPGRRIFNQFRPPPQQTGSAAAAAPWVEHVRRLWPQEGEHEFFFNFCAHMVQRPDEKCNAAVVMAGAQGIGKDAALLPVKAAVGVWNSKEVDPDDLFSPYRPWLQTLMLTINEVRPSKDEFHASSMYNILKPLIAAPPETLPLNDKYKNVRYIINVLRVFITTNEPHAMFIPDEDRRMFMMHSFLPQRWHEAAGQPEYFRNLFAWMRSGGFGHVAAWLAERDISSFDASGPPPKTAGWDAVAGSWDAPDDAFTRALDRLGRPDVLFGQELLDGTFEDREEIAGALKSPRKIAHRMQREGYVMLRRPDGAERWRFVAEGKEFKSRLAFAKQQLLSDVMGTRALVEARGRARALARDVVPHPTGEGAAATVTH